MNTSFARPQTNRNIFVACATHLNPRTLAQEYCSDVEWVHVVPATGVIIASRKTHTVTFDCRQGRSDWRNAMQNVLVGLGCYSTTSSVPSELTDISAGREIAYKIEWEKIPDFSNVVALSPDKSRRPLHSRTAA